MDAIFSADLNLLKTFSTIWEERNLSRAARRLNMSQSAVSHALKRLRDDFGDDLFVRNPRGVTPTDLAIELAPQIEETLKRLELLYRQHDSFDLKTIERKITLVTGDYFSMTFLTPFIRRLNHEAPKIRAIFVPMPGVFDPILFERGKVHLAVTAVTLPEHEGFYQKQILLDQNACCFRRKHPRANSCLDLKTYLEQEHIVVSNFGQEKGIVDQELPGGKSRRVKLVVSSFFDAARILKNSNLLLTAPKKICESLATEYKLQVAPLPFKSANRPIRMMWHRRTHRDPFHRWIRDLLGETVLMPLRSE